MSDKELNLAQSKESDARIIVDDLLRNAGWNPADKNQVMTEQKTPHGYADYVLCDRNGRALAVIEAKREGINPYTAKQQALPYAKDMGANFIFLTNGEIIYFWDYQNDDARPINSFYSQKDLERLTFLRTHQKPLAEIEIPDNFLMHGESLELRPYQKETMQALDHALELGKRRFLIELPTGTGKTALICLYLKRLLKPVELIESYSLLTGSNWQNKLLALCMIFFERNIAFIGVKQA